MLKLRVDEVKAMFQEVLFIVDAWQLGAGRK